MNTVLDDSLGETLTSACRTTIGDQLRSIVYFTPDEFERLYLRDDLAADAALETFVDNERAGFERQATDVDSELGAYHYTVHAYDDGYLVRVVEGDHGVFLTTDELSIARFEELAAAVIDVLRGEYE